MQEYVGTALVTGASSGIGAATARLLRDRGYRVIGTSRAPDDLTPDQRIDGITWLPLDLTDDASIEACAAAATAVGDIDVLVNNAGESLFGALEEVPPDALDRLFRLNVLGAIRLTQLLVPGMRERRRGRVVMVGSMLASFPLAFRSAYVATKAAIKGFADGARYELSPYDVWLTTVEPGAIATGISLRRTKYLADDSPYAHDYQTVLAGLDGNERRGTSAESVAATILTAMEARRPRRLYAIGSRAPVVFALRRLLPAEVIERVVARAHGLRR